MTVKQMVRKANAVYYRYGVAYNVSEATADKIDNEYKDTPNDPEYKAFIGNYIMTVNKRYN